MKIKIALVLLLVMFTIGCSLEQDASAVVVYTSVDQNFSSVVFDRFTEETGVEVKAVYDVEAAKTTGLVNRLIAEKQRPLADVFWNGEIAQTITLASEGVLAAYTPSTAETISERYRDPHWTAFGGRARCLIINTDLLDKETYPTSILDFLSDAYPAKQLAIAQPLFGTTATQAAALYEAWGSDVAQDFYQQIADRGVQIVSGNSVVRDLVVGGQALFGLTDTDDALGAIENGAPVAVVFPDQGVDDIGTLIIPNTVGLIQGAPHPEAGQRFVDWLVDKEQEKFMLEIGWCQVAVRDVAMESKLPIEHLKGMALDFTAVYQQMDTVLSDMRTIFLK